VSSVRRPARLVLSPRHGRPGPHKFGMVAWQRHCSFSCGSESRDRKREFEKKKRGKIFLHSSKGKLYVIVEKSLWRSPSVCQILVGWQPRTLSGVGVEI
jgi:hypothetical protein